MGYSHWRHIGHKKPAFGILGTEKMGSQEWALQEVVDEATACSTNTWGGCHFGHLSTAATQGGSESSRLLAQLTSKTDGPERA